MDRILSHKQFRYAHSTSPNPQHNEIREHAHSRYELLYFISGEARYIIGNLHHQLVPGELIMVPPRLQHNIEILEPKSYERIVVHFKEADVPRGMLEHIFSAPRQLNLVEHPLIRDVFRRMEVYGEKFSQEEFGGLSGTLLTELLYLLADALPTSGAFLDTTAIFGTLQTVIDYINSHLLEIEHIDDLCKNLFLSKSYLHKVFSETLGIGPMKYIKQKRLEVAREMMEFGEKPSSVFVKVRYRDYSTFFRAYKAYFGIPPRRTQTKD